MSAWEIPPGPRGDVVDPLPEVGEPVDAGSDQGKAGVGRVELLVGLFEKEPLHLFHLPGEFSTGCGITRFASNINGLYHTAGCF